LNYFSTQENVTALLNELHLETYPQYHTGKSIAELRRRIYKYSLPIPFISLLSFLESIYNVFQVKQTIGDFEIFDYFFNSWKI
jgi:hypothetical protein